MHLELPTHRPRMRAFASTQRLLMPMLVAVNAAVDGGADDAPRLVSAMVLGMLQVLASTHLRRPSMPLHALF